MGLREIETKSAGNTLNVLKQILEHLDNAQKCDNNVSRDIAIRITAAMSDRAAVKFYEMLCTYRKEILPIAFANYQTFIHDKMIKILLHYRTRNMQTS